MTGGKERKKKKQHNYRPSQYLGKCRELWQNVVFQKIMIIGFHTEMQGKCTNENSDYISFIRHCR